MTGRRLFISSTLILVSYLVPSSTAVSHLAASNRSGAMASMMLAALQGVCVVPLVQVGA